MKHPIQITLIIIAMFLVTQFIGLAVLTSYDNYFGKGSEEKIKTGEIVQPEVSIVKETVPPEMELEKPIDIARIITSIFIAIIIAALLFFLLSKIKVTILIKAWFSVVVFICLTIALSLFLYPYLSTSLFTLFGKKIALAETIAIPLAILLTFYKIFKRDFFIHNLTELFIYPGLAVIFLPLLNVIAASILLVVISIYDMWAVWKSKFMIKLAKFQLDQLKIFTGFLVPHIKKKDKIRIQKMRALARRKEKRRKKGNKKGKRRKEKRLKIKVQLAALGGGDVAFPLIFTGTILFAYGVIPAIVTILCTTLALTLLLTFSQKGKFYPAMPFLSGGCFLGLLLILLL